jgi:dTDP-4-amino-4,6-dideoxygalactose transaminase
MRYLKENGVGCGVYYPVPLHLQPAYAPLKLKRGAFPVSESVSERILALPIYGTMPEEHVARVCELLAAFAPR